MADKVCTCNASGIPHRHTKLGIEDVKPEEQAKESSASQPASSGTPRKIG